MQPAAMPSPARAKGQRKSNYANQQARKASAQMLGVDLEQRKHAQCSKDIVQCLLL